MSSYLVAGAAGFIGWKVSTDLVAQGHRVVGVDNISDAYDVRLKEWRLERLAREPNFEFRRVDISDLDALRPVFEKNRFDAVVNLAARAGVRASIATPHVYFQTNVTGALNLLILARDFSIPKVVLASTSSLYGATNPVPFREDANTDGPLSPYAASKKGAEAVCHAYHHLFGMDVTILRYFTVYGPAGRPDMSPFRFVQWVSEGRPIRVWGDGNQTRDFTYVDDISAGTIAAIAVPGYEVINLGAGRSIVLMDAIRTIESLVGRTAVIEHHEGSRAEMRETLADVGKASELLGWKAEVPFEEGMARLVEWYRAEREWAREVDTSG